MVLESAGQALIGSRMPRRMPGWVIPVIPRGVCVMICGFGVWWREMRVAGSWVDSVKPLVSG